MSDILGDFSSSDDSPEEVLSIDRSNSQEILNSESQEQLEKEKKWYVLDTIPPPNMILLLFLSSPPDQGHRIVFIHASEWTITVDEDDPFKNTRDQLHILHTKYDRRQLLRQPSVQMVQDISRDLLNNVQSQLLGQVQH